MVSFLIRSGKWLLQKLAISVLIAVLGLVGCALWLFGHDRLGFDSSKDEKMEAIVQRRDNLRTVRADVLSRRDEIEAKIRAGEERSERARRIIGILRSLDSRWERWFGNRQQQEINERQIEHLKQLRKDGEASLRREKDLLVRTDEELDGLDRSIGRLERQLQAYQSAKSQLVFYLVAAWLASRYYLGVAVLVYWFGRLGAKLVGWCVLAPLVVRGRPRNFSREPQPQLEFRSGGRPLEVAVWPGDRMWVNVDYLTGESTDRAEGSRWVLTWTLPLTCLLAGLWRLKELRNRYAGPEYRVNLATKADTSGELALVGLSEGGSLLLRGGSVIGVVTPGDTALRVRTRWCLFRWHAWLTGQFRYLEFFGPCQLVVLTQGLLRVERLTTREAGATPVRRLRRNHVLGFTPQIECRLVRGDSCWRFLRDQGPLFEEEYRGSGTLLLGSKLLRRGWRPLRRTWRAALRSVGI